MRLRLGSYERLWIVIGTCPCPTRIEKVIKRLIFLPIWVILRRLGSTILIRLILDLVFYFVMTVWVFLLEFWIP
ncbi:hypothetical protein LINPERPRIM_LOCUS37198 [Linum perenne]